MKSQILNKTKIITFLALIIILYSSASKVYAGCSVASICAAPAGQCGSTCIGGPCKVGEFTGTDCSPKCCSWTEQVCDTYDPITNECLRYKTINRSGCNANFCGGYDCTGGGECTEKTVPSCCSPPADPPPASCGDGVCNGSDGPCNCPGDCAGTCGGGGGGSCESNKCDGEWAGQCCSPTGCPHTWEEGYSNTCGGGGGGGGTDPCFGYKCPTTRHCNTIEKCDKTCKPKGIINANPVTGFDLPADKTIVVNDPKDNAEITVLGVQRTTGTPNFDYDGVEWQVYLFNHPPEDGGVNCNTIKKSDVVDDFEADGDIDEWGALSCGKSEFSGKNNNLAATIKAIKPSDPLPDTYTDFPNKPPNKYKTEYTNAQWTALKAQYDAYIAGFEFDHYYIRARGIDMCGADTMEEVGKTPTEWVVNDFIVKAELLVRVIKATPFINNKNVCKMGTTTNYDYRVETSPIAVSATGNDGQVAALTWKTFSANKPHDGRGTIRVPMDYLPPYETSLTLNSQSSGFGGACGQSLTVNGLSAPRSGTHEFYLEAGAAPIVNNISWWQVVGGSIHANAGDSAGQGANATVKSTIPADCSGSCLPYILLQGNQPKTTGVISKTSVNPITTGSAATFDQEGKNLLATSRYNGRKENYAYFTRLVELPISPQPDWPTTSLTKPTVPGVNGINNVYFIDTDAEINEAWDVAAGESFTVFINGNLTINAPITVAEGGFVAFIAAQNIAIAPTVGNANPADNTGVVEGIYVASNTFSTGSAGTSDDLRLVLEGTFVGWQGVTFDRVLNATANPSYAAEYFVARPDFLVNTPDTLKSTISLWQEVSP